MPAALARLAAGGVRRVQERLSAANSAFGLLADTPNADPAGLEWMARGMY
jgi:hypothetical protein